MEAFASPRSPDPQPGLQPGTPVLVRNSLDLWSPGFRIEAWRGNRCEVRRGSDGAVLPRTFSTDEIRRA